MTRPGGHRGWIGAAVVPLGVLMVLRGLRNTDLIAGTPLGHWSGRLVAVVVALACYGAVHLLVSRAFRDRS